MQLNFKPFVDKGKLDKGKHRSYMGFSLNETTIRFTVDFYRKMGKPNYASIEYDNQNKLIKIIPNTNDIKIAKMGKYDQRVINTSTLKKIMPMGKYRFMEE